MWRHHECCEMGGTPHSVEDRTPGAGKETLTRVARSKGVRGRIRAVCGIWLLEGRLVKLHEDHDTGALLASYSNGARESPLRVLTHGTRAELPEWPPHPARSRGGEEA